ncbi:MAG: response regulator [Deltaproteobacteria bacterium]|nr:response regulator [Deltaproteobacteria bacterium]MBW2071423.1 response regulator [Deltaproteobacteria bacterium]
MEAPVVQPRALKLDRTEQAEQATVLIVDDEKPVRTLFGRLLEMGGYQCTLAANAAEARGYLKEQRFDLILSDVNMPGESGLDFARYVLRRHPNTAVVIMTGVDDPEVAKTALDIGAYGYVTKPVDHNDVLFNVSNALRRRNLEMDSRLHRENLERIVQERTAKLREREAKLHHALATLGKAMEGVVQAMALTVETRDPYTAGHQRRVAELAHAIGKEMSLPESQLDGIRIAAIIHDLGKISVPAEILSKPGRISDIEFNMIKSHSQVGYDILKNIEFPWPVAEIVLQHHERLNGSGYPQGLEGEEILLEARIISVADVVEAMASHRPYRPALGIDRALEEILQNSGVLYDPEVAKACVRLFREKGFTLG